MKAILMAGNHEASWCGASMEKSRPRLYDRRIPSVSSSSTFRMCTGAICRSTKKKCRARNDSGHQVAE
jgi:hypothetical protein